MKKLKNKTKYLQKTIFMFLAAAILTACGNTSGSPDDKAAQLEQLKKEKASLDEKIKTLEAEIAKENPDALVRKPIIVSLDTLSTQTFEHFIEVQGTVEAEDNVVVSAETPATITAIYVNEGQRVSKGQTLAKLDSKVLQSSIQELKTSLGLAETTYQRQKNLWDQKIGTEFQYLQAKNNKEALEQKLQTLNKQLEMYKIVSPINGTIDQVISKIGENAAPGVPSFRVVNLSDLNVKANVSDSYSALVDKGNEVMINFPDINKNIREKIDFVGRVIDPVSRSFEVQIQLSASKEYKPNMVAILKIIDYKADEAMVVPINKIREIKGNDYVFIAAEKDGKKIAKQVKVGIGKKYNGQAEILSGLQAGDKLITVGFQNLVDGSPIDY